LDLEKVTKKKYIINRLLDKINVHSNNNQANKQGAKQISVFS
jgi:hypothetical protein